MIHVYLNNVSARVTPRGEVSATIQAQRSPAFAGDAGGCVEYLKALGIGQSVEVRWLRDDKWTRIRSCMNKPALWADLLAGPV